MLKLLWSIWFVITALGASWLVVALPSDGPPTSASTIFLPGQTTHGHHQIEMNCSACHLPDGGITDQSCIDCHGADLKASRDTHPESKFRDPKKAPLLEKLDAQNCLTCHVEHQEERTHPMGVTLPEDFCWHCHQDVAQDRPSHQDFAFNSCANAGCHNYHDNTALYENFLKNHLGDANIIGSPQNPLRKLQQWLKDQEQPEAKQLFAAAADPPSEWQHAKITASWANSAHALTGVNCSGCHTADHDLEKIAGDNWVAAPDHESCSGCHKFEVSGFLEGKHGMRIASGLSSMSPELARLPMHASAAHKELNCSACHDPHQPDLQFAAVDACLSCHNDQHSQSYLESSHHQLWRDDQSGLAAAGSGVSCATCHMPRDEDGIVQHNQNHNFQPNEKMARTVCLNCHGLQFTLDSLADPLLKADCYSTTPVSTVQSLQMVRDWFESKQKK